MQDILSPLSMPKRGPQDTLGYHRVFNLIVWVLYTGMQWKCFPVRKDRDGTATIHTGQQDSWVTSVMLEVVLQYA